MASSSQTTGKKNETDNVDSQLLFSEDNPFKAETQMEDSLTICLSLTLYLLIGGLMFGGTMWVILKLHKDATSPAPSIPPAQTSIFAPPSITVNHEEENEHRLRALQVSRKAGQLTGDSTAERIMLQRFGKPETGKRRQSDFDAILSGQLKTISKDEQFIDWMFPITQMDSSLAVRRYSDWKELSQLTLVLSDPEEIQSFIQLFLDGVRALQKLKDKVDIICDNEHPKRKEYVLCSLNNFALMTSHLGRNDDHRKISLMMGDLMEMYSCLPSWKRAGYTEPKKIGRKINAIDKVAQHWCEVESFNMDLIIADKKDDDQFDELIQNRAEGWKW